MKFRICEILGVEVGQKFQISGVRDDIVYSIDSDGHFNQYLDGQDRGAGCSDCLCDAINHPELVVKKISWEEQDVEDAKAVKRLWQTWEDDCEEITITRTKARLSAELRDRQNGQVYDHCFISGECFPSVQVGQTVKVDDIHLFVS